MSKMIIIIKLKDGKIIKTKKFRLFSNSINLNNLITISLKYMKEIHIYNC